MKNCIYKTVELTGTSSKGIEEAIKSAISRIHEAEKKPGWFEVVETRGNIEKGKVLHWQVTLKIGLEMMD